MAFNFSDPFLSLSLQMTTSWFSVRMLECRCPCGWSLGWGFRWPQDTFLFLLTHICPKKHSYIFCPSCRWECNRLSVQLSLLLCLSHPLSLSATPPLSLLPFTHLFSLLMPHSIANASDYQFTVTTDHIKLSKWSLWSPFCWEMENA